jgi:hypothetical protein
MCGNRRAFRNVLTKGRHFTASEGDRGREQRIPRRSIRGRLSVAKKVAEELWVRHIYCDPDRNERQALNIRTNEDRETIWMHRVRPFSPNEVSIVFVCGADHSLTFGSYQAERAQAIADNEDAQCQSYGAQPGSQAYIQCRMYATS